MKVVNKMKKYLEHNLDDMIVRYPISEEGVVGLELVPVSKKESIKANKNIILNRWCN